MHWITSGTADDECFANKEQDSWCVRHDSSTRNILGVGAKSVAGTTPEASSKRSFTKTEQGNKLVMIYDEPPKDHVTYLELQKKIKNYRSKNSPLWIACPCSSADTTHQHGQLSNTKRSTVGVPSNNIGSCKTCTFAQGLAEAFLFFFQCMPQQHGWNQWQR